MATRAAPFDSLTVADLGDVPLNTFNPAASVALIASSTRRRARRHRAAQHRRRSHHHLSIFRALAAQHGPVGIVHVDAHADVNDTMFGERVTHGTWMRRAIEETSSIPAAPSRSAYAARVTAPTTSTGSPGSAHASSPLRRAGTDRSPL